MLVNNLVNGNVFIDGTSWFGTFKEFTLPVMKALYEEHEALGQNAKLELVTGTDLMTGNMKLNAPYADLMKLFADPYLNRQIQLRGNLETYTGAQRTGQNAYVCYLNATFKQVPGGMIKSKAGVEIETEINVTYMKLEIAGQSAPIFEIDVMNNIQNVNGVDILAQFRANLGI